MLARSIQKYYIFVLLFLLAILQSSCQQSGNKYRILVVHSYESDYVAYKDCDRLIRKSLEKKGINPSIQTFYLNCEQYAAPAEEKRMYLYLDSISTWKPDLILVYEDQATYTLMQCHHPLISTVPIVFGGVNFPNKALLAQYSNVSGFWDEPDYVTNIRLIEHLLGKSTIYMLHDSTYIDRHIKATLHEQCAQADIRVDNNRIMYIPVEIATLERVNQSLKRPDSTTVNVVPVQGDKLSAVSWYMSKHVPYIYYLQAKRDYRVLNTSRFSSKPSFTAINEDLGYSNKLVGGYITSLETQIEESTDRAAEILKGSPSESFPQITKSKKNYVFDFNEVKYWNIDKRLLPKDAILLNFPFKDQYPRLFWSLIIVVSTMCCFVFSSFIIMYTQESKAKRQAQKALLHEKESLAEALEKANESDRMKSVFLANMSHEIRTPLNALSGFSTILTEESIDEETRKQCNDIIQQNSELLLKLINDVIDLSSLEIGKMTFKFKICDAVGLCRNVIDMVEKIKQTHADVRFSTPLDSLELLTDSARLQQVLINLLINATKFTSQGSITLQLEQQTEDTALFSVTDTGTGIPKEKQKKIFNRFEKLNENAQGTGLGLSICQLIIEQLGGSIWIDPDYEEGSRFLFTHPIDKSDQGKEETR